MAPSGTSPVLVGRTEELRILAEHARHAHHEAAGAVLLGGEAGVGKSRLLAEFAERTGNALVVSGGCLELGVEGVPFAPFVTVLRQLQRELGTERFAELAGDGPRELARLLPELGPAPEERPEARGRMFEQVLRLLWRAADDGGLTVILDDLHWAESATRHLLVFLLRNLETARVQVVCCYRTNDLNRGHPLRRLLAELERLPTVTRLELGPLTREQVAEQVRAIRGADVSAAQLAVLYERTGGNPLFVESLLDLPDTNGTDLPERPRELLLGPLHALDADARHVAAVASVGARGTDLIAHGPLARVAGLDEDRLDAALHTLVDANVLRVADSGAGYRFRHALLREAVHAELLPGRHARLHLDYATALESDPAFGPAGGCVAELAHHYNAAGDQPRALSAAWWAGERARAAYGFDEQLRMQERVVELWARVDDAEQRVGLPLPGVLEQASEAAIDSGETARGLELAEAGLDLLPHPEGEGAADPTTATLRALLLRRRGQALRDLGESGALEDVREAARVLPADSPHRPSVLATLAGELTLHTRFAEALATAEEAMHEALKDDDTQTYGCAQLQHAAAVVMPQAVAPAAQTATHARLTRATLYLQEGAYDTALREIDACLERAAKLDDPSTETRATALRVALLWENGRLGEAVAAGWAGLERARALSTVRTFGTLVAINLAEALFHSGELSECHGLTSRALSWDPMPLYRSNLHARRGLAALAMGDVAAAREDQRRHRPSSRDRLAHMQDELPSALLDLELLLAEGHPGEAVTAALAVLTELTVELWPPYAWQVLECAGRIMRAAREREPGAAEGDGEDVTRLSEEVARAWAATPVSGPSQTALRATVRAHLVEAGVPGPLDVRPAWDEAVRLWRAGEDPYQLAAALLGRARAAAADGDRAGAVDGLDEAASLARGIGARTLERQVTDLARRLGVALDGASAPPAEPAGLTPRETEVLRLLARGATNAQIAEELFISTKTASVHVSNILGKLAAPNRAAAAARARELGVG